MTNDSALVDLEVWEHEIRQPIAPPGLEGPLGYRPLTEIGLDHYGRYRDNFVPVGDAWLIKHRYVSTDWRAPDSTMAPTSSIH